MTSVNVAPIQFDDKENDGAMKVSQLNRYKSCSTFLLWAVWRQWKLVFFNTFEMRITQPRGGRGGGGGGGVSVEICA